MINIYKAFIRLHLDYGDVIFDQAFNNSFNQRLYSIHYNAEVYYAVAYTFPPQPSRFLPKKISYFFAKKPALEKFLIFSQKNVFLHVSENGTFSEKCFSYISGNFLALRLKDFRRGHSELKKRPILKKFLLFWEMKPSSPRIKNFLIFQEGTSKFQAEKNNFLYFFLFFQK